ncbi:MAG TPA: alpha/beta fold hydrolase [Thermoanaerobaculia bacterium]|nr:alpha/beta fold hydrolase [Thermoanaerobaculia bacterium]
MDDGGHGGLPVLFVHGNSGNRTQWAAQLEHLRAARRAVAFDLRGMGESEPAANTDYSVEGFAEDVAAVADALGLERFVLVGHSYGGAVVAAYAGKHPERLAGLVFADVAGDIRNPPPAQAEALRRGLLPENYGDFTRRWFEGILVKGTDATKSAVFRSLLATRPEVFIAATNSLSAFDPAAALAAYRGPWLHIASYVADNPIAIHRGFKDMPVRVIPDASHWLMMDRPEEFNRILDDFLAGVTSPSPGGRGPGVRGEPKPTKVQNLNHQSTIRIGEPSARFRVLQGNEGESVMKTKLLRPLYCVIAFALAAGTAQGESRMEKSLKLEPGGQFRLETDMGRVTVRGTSDSGVRLVVTSKRDDINDLLSFHYEEGGRSAAVIARKRHPLSSWFGNWGSSVHFEVEVPSETAVNVHTSGGGISLAALRSPAKIETSGGGIEVRDLVGDLQAETSGGSIHLRDIKGKSRVETSGGGIEAANLEGPLNAETSGGSIALERVSGDIHAHSSGGGIHIREAGGRVDADTSGGSIEASFTRGNGRGGTLESSGGGITVSVDPAVSLAIDAHGNSVSSDLPLTVQGEFSRGSLRGTLGRGGENLRLRTSGGSVKIRAI